MGGAASLSLLVVGLTALAALVSYGVAWYSWRRADYPVANRFALLMVADGSWALFSFLEMVSPTDELSKLWAAPLAMSGALAAALWFTFVVDYTGDSDWIPSVVERVVVGQAVVYGLVYAVNPGGVVYTELSVAQWGFVRLTYEGFGPVLIGELLFVYALLAVTFGLLGRFFLRTRNFYRKQTGVIFASTLLIAVAHVAFFAGFTPHPRLDLTPVFFVVQAIGVGIALTRYDFLDVTPLAATTLIEELVDPVFVVDRDGRLLDWNAAAAAYVDESPGGTERPTLSTVAIPGLEDALVRGDGGTSGADVAVTATHGHSGRESPVTYDVRRTPIDDHYGVTRGYAIVLRDITERRARKRALEHQNERLEEFTGLVSHDLRNPLQVANGFLELAQETGDPEHVERASEAVDRMGTLVDDLLRLAREGRMIDETEDVDLADCCRRAWASVDTADARLVVDVEGTVPADGSRLRQVFENLFRNSVEHGSTDSRSHAHGNAPLTVTVGTFADGFYVADDGRGIPESERESVFELGETTDEDGSGFGLTIVERIVEAHGWSIAAVESETGGARFEIRTRPRPDGFQ